MRYLESLCSWRLTLYEGEDLLVLLFGLTLLHQVDLVLQDEDVLQLHDLYGCEMLGRLRLRTRLVTRWQTRGKRERNQENNLQALLLLHRFKHFKTMHLNSLWVTVESVLYH